MFSKINNNLIQSVDWQEVKQGSSNRIFTANHRGELLVLRLNASNDYAFGVDRYREAQMLSIIQGQSWAPVIIENNLVQGWCLMHDHGSTLEHLLGLPCATKDRLNLALVTLLKQLQDFSNNISLDSAQPLGFDYSGLFDHYKVRLGDDAENNVALLLCHTLETAFGLLPKVSNTLVHHDLHAQNICYKIHNGVPVLTLIDWEYAGWGNPWLDVAACHFAFGIKASALARLPFAVGLTRDQFNKGLVRALLINRALENLWYWIRVESSVDSAKSDQQNIVSKSVLYNQIKSSIESFDGV